MSRRARAFLTIGQSGGMLSQFRTAAVTRETEAAKIATDTSRSVFQSHLSGRPLAPPRVGRLTTGGAFASFVNWSPDHRKNNIVFDTAALQHRAPYFLIQEIGTGRTAQILNPPGTISVRSQRGRPIAINLYWAGGPGAAWTSPGRGGALEQLYLASDLNMKSGVRTRRMRIRREIKGKHYLRDGGAQGFRTLATGLSADAKRIFQ